MKRRSMKTMPLIIPLAMILTLGGAFTGILSGTSAARITWPMQLNYPPNNFHGLSGHEGENRSFRKELNGVGEKLRYHIGRH